MTPATRTDRRPLDRAPGLRDVVAIVVIPGVGFSIDLFTAGYADAMSDWLGGLFAE